MAKARKMNIKQFAFLLGVAFSIITCAHAQTYQVHKPPIVGHFQLKKETKPGVIDPTPGLAILSDSVYLYASANGKVIDSKQLVGRYSVTIQYGIYNWVYSNLEFSYVKKGEQVCLNKKIGKIEFDSILKKNSFNLQIYKGSKILHDGDYIKILHAKKYQQ